MAIKNEVHKNKETYGKRET